MFVVTLTARRESACIRDSPNAPDGPDRGSSGLQWWGFARLPPRARLEHEYSKKNAKDQNDKEKDDGDGKQDFRKASGARRDIRKTEKSRDHRYDKKYGCPFKHELLHSVIIHEAALVADKTMRSVVQQQRSAHEVISVAGSWLH
jgi:hypothetical protein